MDASRIRPPDDPASDRNRVGAAWRERSHHLLRADGSCGLLISFERLIADPDARVHGVVRPQAPLPCRLSPTPTASGLSRAPGRVRSPTGSRRPVRYAVSTSAPAWVRYRTVRRCSTAGARCRAPARAAPARSRALVAGIVPSTCSSAARASGPRRGDGPSPGGAHADPQAVVLAHEEEGMAAPGARRGPRCSRAPVRSRGWATRRRAADRQRGMGPRARHSDPRARRRQGDAEGARQVGGDGRGLGDDREVVVAEDLVPAAGDRLEGCRRHPSRMSLPASWPA